MAPVIFFGSLCAFPQLKAKEAEAKVKMLVSASFTESTKRPRGFHVWFYCSYTKKMDYLIEMDPVRSNFLSSKQDNQLVQN